MATKMAARAATETAALSAAEIAVERNRQIAVRDAAEAEHQELVAGSNAAALAGDDALAAHELKVEAARRRATVAGARVDDLTRQYDEAEERERYDGISARYRRAEQASRRMRAEIEAAYGQLREIFAVLVREKALDDEIAEINKLIAAHRPPDLERLPGVEAWRFEPAVPEVEEEIEVERDVHRTREIQGDAPGSTKIQALPETERRMVKERRVVKPALAQFAPAPLYDMFAVPRLRRDDPHLIVPFTSARVWWNSWQD
jgi:hypothetical protein